jgi:Fe2+ or Zn2+ uptake regulation protein
VNAAQLRAELIEVLARTSEPITTSIARIALSERADGRDRPVVAEQVYRALLILQRKGIVRRVHDQPGRLAHWELTRSAQPVVPQRSCR